MAANPDDRILDRLAKLLELSRNNRNEHEAAAAAAKAQALAFKYNIDLARVQPLEDAGDGVEFSYFTLSQSKGKATTNWHRTLISVIADTNFCRVVWWKGTKDVGIVGRRHNQEVVTYLYEYLAAEIQRLADQGWKDSGYQHVAVDPWFGVHPTKWKKSFCLGAVAVVSERLHKQRAEDEKQVGTDSMALVTQEDAAVEDALHERFPRLNTEHKKQSVDWDAFCTGARKGLEIRLNKALPNNG
jgi:hypothetical protein